MDNGLAPGNWGVEQYTLTLQHYAATSDLNVVTSRVAIADMFLRNAATNGEQAARSLDDLARNALFAPYLGGNTRVRTTLTIAAAFGCPFEGEVAVSRVREVVAACAATPPDELAFADTIGLGVPPQVHDLTAVAGSTMPGVPLRWHFHNTRNTGYANAWAAVVAADPGLPLALEHYNLLHRLWREDVVDWQGRFRTPLQGFTATPRPLERGDRAPHRRERAARLADLERAPRVPHRVVRLQQRPVDGRDGRLGFIPLQRPARPRAGGTVRLGEQLLWTQPSAPLRRVRVALRLLPAGASA